MIVGGEVLELLDQLELAERFTELELLGQPDVAGHDRIGELRERFVPEGGEHLRDLGLLRCDVATSKGVGRCEQLELHGGTLTCRGEEGSPRDLRL